MKKLFLFFISFCILLLFGCSKDFLKRYEKRIIGTWRISDINRIGIGGSSNLPFTSGTFTFHDDGSLEYINSANTIFKGTWQIDKKVMDDQTYRSLQITAVDFNNQQVLSEYYDNIIFTSTNHFKAEINSNFQTYITHFRR